MATVNSVTWICKFKSLKTQLAQVRMIKRETHWQLEFKRRHLEWKCTRIEDTLKSRDICILPLVLVFVPKKIMISWKLYSILKKRHSEKRRQTPNSPLAKEVKQKYVKLKIVFFSSFERTRNLRLQPLDPECTSFSPDRLDTEPEPPFKMFRCNHEIFPLTIPNQWHPKPLRYKWGTP